MSSGFQDQLGCLRRIIAAMGTLPVRAVVTTGPALDPAALDPPGNVTVLAAAPHRQVLDHAALVVTHGGHGAVMKALAAGVPMVVLHHGRDQADNAARVTARGAGLAVKRTATPAAVARAAAGCSPTRPTRPPLAAWAKPPAATPTAAPCSESWKACQRPTPPRDPAPAHRAGHRCQGSPSRRPATPSAIAIWWSKLWAGGRRGHQRTHRAQLRRQRHHLLGVRQSRIRFE